MIDAFQAGLTHFTTPHPDQEAGSDLSGLLTTAAGYGK